MISAVHGIEASIRNLSRAKPVLTAIVGPTVSKMEPSHFADRFILQYFANYAALSNLPALIGWRAKMAPTVSIFSGKWKISVGLPPYTSGIPYDIWYGDILCQLRHLADSAARYLVITKPLHGTATYSYDSTLVWIHCMSKGKPVAASKYLLLKDRRPGRGQRPGASIMLVNEAEALCGPTRTEAFQNFSDPSKWDLRKPEKFSGLTDVGDTHQVVQIPDILTPGLGTWYHSPGFEPPPLLLLDEETREDIIFH